MPTKEIHVQFRMNSSEVSGWKKKPLVDFIKHCSDNYLFCHQEAGYLPTTLNDRINHSNIDLELDVDTKNIVKANWHGHSGSLLSGGVTFNTQIPFNTVNMQAEKNKTLLESIRSIVAKGNHSKWKDHEEGYLPGIVSKLNSRLEGVNINTLSDPQINRLMNDVKQIASDEQGQKRNPLCFWKPSNRSTLTTDLIEAVKQLDSSKLVTVITNLQAEHSSNFGVSPSGGDDDL